MASAEDMAGAILRYLEENGYLQAPPCLANGSGEPVAAQA